MNELRSTSRPILCNLAPIGVGTSHAESLEGYLYRLACAHSVGIRAMKTYVAEGAKMTHSKAVAIRPDLPAKVHSEVARRLPGLTHQSDSASLGLGRLFGRLNKHYVIRAERCWCPECLRGMQAGTSYWPLVWNLEGYAYCSRHRLPTMSACPQCGFEFKVGSEWFPNAGCPQCGENLGKVPDKSAREPVARVEVAMSAAIERFCAESSAIPDLEAGCRESGLDRTIDLALAMGAANSQPELAGLLGLTPMFLGRLRGNDGTPPTLSVLSRLSVLTGVPIAGIVYEPLWRSDDSRVPVQELKELALAHGASRPDYVVIQETARQAIAADEGTSLNDLASSLCMCASQLRSILGTDTAGQLAEGVRRRRRKLAAEQHDVLVAQIREVCGKLKKTGELLSAARVARELQCFGEHPRFMRAYRQASPLSKRAHSANGMQRDA